MGKKQTKNPTLLGLIGAILLLSGMTLIFRWWPDVVTFVKGVIGMGLAMTGMLILYIAKQK